MPGRPPCRLRLDRLDRRRRAPLDAEGRVVAARFASLFPTSATVQLVGTALLFVGLGLLLAGQVASSDLLPPALLIALIAASLATFAVTVPISAARIRRAGRYAAEHADDLERAPAVSA